MWTTGNQDLLSSNRHKILTERSAVQGHHYEQTDLAYFKFFTLVR